jgi:carboxypeptidase PM20D1
MRKAAIPVLAAVVIGVNGWAHAEAQPTHHPQAEAEALDLAKKAVALRSVAGPGIDYYLSLVADLSR